MRYSVSGVIPVTDGAPIVAAINQYQLWRLVTARATDEDWGEAYTFEAWVSNESDKAALLNDLKPFVDSHGGKIYWHICTHDEAERSPCVIAESYPIGG